MSMLGLIFSNIGEKEVFEVSKNRTIASTPIGGRYRLIDFHLSNMVNSGISNIGIMTKTNYLSLMDHLGSGKEWDLARKHGGLVILPPYGASSEGYSTRLGALKQIVKFIENSRDEYVVLTDCYNVNNIDYTKIFEFHKKKNADITCVYRHCHKEENYIGRSNIFTLDADDRVVNMEIIENPGEVRNTFIDICIMKRELLLSLINKAIELNYNSFNNDLLKRHIDSLKIYGYLFEGYFGNLLSMKSFYNINMDLLDNNIRKQIFNRKNFAIYTKVRDSAPTIYGENAVVKNSLIADGCVIDGVVENSIIFRGTKIAKNAVVKDSILMQDTTIGDGVALTNVVTDKNVTIKNEKELVGTKTEPIYIVKNEVL